MIDESKYTQLPNAILNAPDMSNREFRLTAVLYGLTWNGKKKRSVKATTRDFMKLTGMSRNTVKGAVQDALKRGIFKCTNDTWVLCQKLTGRVSKIDTEVSKIDRQLSKIDTKLSKIDTFTPDSKLDSKQVEVVEAPTPLKTLEEFLINEHGMRISWNLGNYNEKWIEPLTELLKHGKDVELIKRAMANAIRQQAQDGLPTANPQNIYSSSMQFIRANRPQQVAARPAPQVDRSTYTETFIL